MRALRWILALAGVIVGTFVLVTMDRSDPIGAAVQGPSELPEYAEGTWPEADWEIFQRTVQDAAAAGLDTVSFFGDAVVGIGRMFVGTAYVPGTLEVEGPERIVIDFQGLDCVTFVENAIALARFVREDGVRRLADRSAAEDRYEGLLEQIRYRSGRLDGYASRLHYFSEWISDNRRRSLLGELGPALGAVVDEEPIDFMSTHPDAYRQLADTRTLRLIRETEDRLNARERRYVPEDRIDEVAELIRDGDVIAATSTVEGLDVAHTGLAIHVDGRLHLLHAPLVGDSVEISELPLAERILRIESQDGIMVARPQEG